MIYNMVLATIERAQGFHLPHVVWPDGSGEVA